MRRFCFISIFLFLIFLLRLFLFPEPKFDYLPGQKITLVTTLTSEPKVFGQTQRFETQGLMVVARRYPQYHYGEKLKISGSLREEVSNQKRKVLDFPQIEILSEKGGNWLMVKISQLRQNLVATYQSFLPGPSSALLSGIVLGSKHNLPPDFYEALKMSGTLHVVVASGMNVTLVAGFLTGLFGYFLKRQWATIASLGGVVFYTALAGFEPPIVRASIMSGLALTAQGFGRQNWGVLSLFLAGYIMLLIKPSLISDLGFQLSFLATAGLLLVKPALSKLERLPLLGESFTTTLAAQLAVLPLLLGTFGQYSLLSLLTNTLVLWTIPWIMGFGAVVGVAGLIFPALGQILAFLLYPFLFYFEIIVGFLGKLGWFSLKSGKFSWSLAFGYWLILAAILWWGERRRRR